MANRNYVNGRAFEYRTRDAALKLGAIYVMRAASSKGAADLIVLWHPVSVALKVEPPGSAEAVYIAPMVWLVQCKRDGRLPKAEAIELKRIADAAGALPVLAKIGPNGRGVEFQFLNEQEC